jgi:N6-adenosine-specific RNA methylase IME4
MGKLPAVIVESRLSKLARQHVKSIPAAVRALGAMERELESAKTYAQIRKIVTEAKAIKVLLADVDTVKAQAEDVILIACARIGEEIEKIPKAKGGGQLGKGGIPQTGKSTGRTDTDIPHTSRSRYQTLAKNKGKLKDTAAKLRKSGRDASPRAVASELTQGDKKQARVHKEKTLGAKIAALPDQRYGVIYADPPWKFAPYSEETGMDRAADNHYPTMDVAAICALEVPSAKDCVLFLWATVPMLPQALEVMGAWGFEYKSHFAWIKNKAGTGFWARNKHELLLIGTRGSIPAPAHGEQYASAIEADRGKHSTKPFAFREMIEDMFPTLPKLEMFAREKFEGWDAWGNEVAEAAE